MSPRERRQAARCSLARAAVLANVSEPTARLYEANPEAVKDPIKRAELARLYDSFPEPAAWQAPAPLSSLPPSGRAA
jgi:hypothetical protein